MKRIALLLLLSVLAAAPAARADEAEFKTKIKPLLDRYCLRCHNADKAKAGIRLDQLDGKFEDRRLRLWQAIQDQVGLEAMPPEDERQPKPAERELLDEWIGAALNVARNRKRPNHGTIRRLTVSQYRNSLRDVLGIDDDFTDVLPPDGVSKDGFTNHGKTLLLSPLLVEAYFDIAEKALDAAIVDARQQPVIQNFRMDLGKAINDQPCPDKLILGANSHLLPNEDFVVRELAPQKPFTFTPFAMRTKYRFHEGYQGNATVRGWREYDSIYHAVFACMRGAGGYPLGRPYESVSDGLLLRPAIPTSLIFQQSSTYGPQANFKISLRELPNSGRFRVTVNAAKFDDALLLKNAPLAKTEEAIEWEADAEQAIPIAEPGVYQVDAYRTPHPKAGTLTVKMGGRKFTTQIRRWQPGKKKDTAAEEARLSGTPLMLVRLAAGELKIAIEQDNVSVTKLELTRLDPESDLARRFAVFEKRAPYVGVHLGLRRDCGSTLTPVGSPQRVAGRQLSKFVFEGAISNFPSPDVEENNDNYLAGVREIGVRSEYLDGRDMPRLRIQSVEFEGPLYETWPPKPHRQIFIDSPNKAKQDEAYAREVVSNFATRAFRRPVEPAEIDALMRVWKSEFAATQDFQQSTKDTLLVVLTSPQFLFLIERSESPEPERLGEFELASKLSYFLWNAPPDSRLLSLAEEGRLHQELDVEFERMIADSRFDSAIARFVEQWLRLDKLDVVETDHKRYPRLTRVAKAHLRREPVETVKHVIRENLPLKHLIESEFIVANDAVAAYYGLGEESERGFAFAPLPHRKPELGGLLSQAAILAGLSDGRESNPVKRGAWLARKIIAKPPADPPPNVPQLEEDGNEKLTLRQRLERHRNQEGCRKCHEGIDPWGIPFEQFDAGGLLKLSGFDARSTLPDNTDVADLKDLKAHLAGEMHDQAAFSFLKHLATYATGRSLGFREIELLKEKGLELKPDGYLAKDMLRFVIHSDYFLTK